MASNVLTIYDLPNEILVYMLSSFHTHKLLPLTLVSHRFHNLVLRILHYRLLLAGSSPEYKVILEAYLPSRRYTRPYLYCEYLGTNGLSSKIEGKGSIYEDLDEEGGKIGGRLARLGALYSRFRPEYPDVEGNMPVRRVAGAAPNLQSNTAGLNLDWYTAPTSSAMALAGGAAISNPGAGTGVGEPVREEGNHVTDQPTSLTQPQGQQTGLPSTQPIYSDKGDGGNKRVIYVMNIDAEELFVQFCAASTLVKLGPRRGVFLSYVPIDQGDKGVIRVWREWLLQRAKLLHQQEIERRNSYTPLERTATDLGSEDIVKDKSILWTDYRKNIGLKLEIRERPIPGVEARGIDDEKDDIPLRFELEIKELLVRTTSLMLAVEESEELQNQPGEPLSFISWKIQVNQYPEG